MTLTETYRALLAKAAGLFGEMPDAMRKKRNPRLVIQKKLVTRNGKTFQQGFLTDPNAAQASLFAPPPPAKPAPRPKPAPPTDQPDLFSSAPNKTNPETPAPPMPEASQPAPKPETDPAPRETKKPAQTKTRNGEIELSTTETQALETGDLHVGDTKMIGDRKYTLNANHRWQRDTAPQTPQKATQPTPEAQASPAPTPTPATPAEPRQTRKSENYSDVGEKIGMARKDLAELRRAYSSGEKQVTAGDLETLENDPGFAATMVTRDNVGGKPDAFTHALKDAGATPGAAFLMRRAYAAIAPKPDQSADGRRLYVLGTQYVQNIMSQCKTYDQWRDAAYELRNSIRYGFSYTPEEKTRVSAINLAIRKHNDRASTTMSIEQARALRNDPELAQLRQELQGIQQTARAREVSDPNATGKIIKALGDRFLNTLDGRNDSTNKALTQAIRYDTKQDWTWLEAKPAPREKPTTSDKPKWERDVPETVERVGGRTETFNADRLKNAFNLRGVEYGNWMDEESSREHTQRAGEALYDLADVLGLGNNPSLISLNGRLAMAFGARGSGKAAAHYEPARKVVNMTKFQGGGSLAHEWGHALDNILGMLSRQMSVPGVTSGGELQMITTDGGFTTGQKPGTYSGLPKSVQDALKNVKAAIYDGSIQAKNTMSFEPADDSTAEGRGRKEAIAKGFSTWKWADDQIARSMHPQELMNVYTRRIAARYKGKKLRETLESSAKYLATKYNRPISYDIAEEGSGGPTSNFVATAEKMGEYWKRPHELFARAFESYVMDKLKDKGMRNSYLVSGVRKENVEAWAALHPLIERHGGKTSLYPRDEERTRINAAFDQLVSALNEHEILAKAARMLERHDRHQRDGDGMPWKVKERGGKFIIVNPTTSKKLPGEFPTRATAQQRLDDRNAAILAKAHAQPAQPRARNLADMLATLPTIKRK